MSNKEIWQFILSELEAERKIILFVIVDAKGHTPGRQGFGMAVSSSGEIFGTIGGGTLEHITIQKSKEYLQNGISHSVLSEHSMEEHFDPSSGNMICGGSIILASFPLETANFNSVKKIMRGISDDTPGIIYMDSEAGIGFKDGLAEEKLFVKTDSAKWRYQEPVNTEPQVHIIGGGHVCLALSKVLSTLGYKIFVYDSRPDVDTMIKNTYADKKIITSFDSIAGLIPENERTWIVIMTPQHTADASVLRQVIRKKVRYIGLMSSPKKFSEISEYLTGLGMDKADIERVHSPIGLSIGSETPAEIAISIAAEIVKIHHNVR